MKKISVNNKFKCKSFSFLDFILGITLGYTIGYFRGFSFLADVFSKINWPKVDFSFVFSFVPNPSFLGDIAAFEGVLIGVAIPISLQVVSWTADRYRDQEIAKLFIKESLYRLQYYLLLSNIIAVVLLKFFDIKNSILLIVMVFFFLFSVYLFFKFIKLVESYASDTDQVILSKLQKNVQDIFEK